MEPFFSRYRNVVVLLAALLLQVIGLAVQVRKVDPGASGVPGSGLHEPKDGRSVRLIRLWVAGLVTPLERTIHGSSEGAGGLWGSYIDLRHTKDQNRELEQTIDRLRLEQATLLEDARQGHRLQAVLKFQESYVYKTLPAQVIGTSGSSQSHVLYIDKGAADGLGVDMAVITPDGIVGKVREVFPRASQVLVINDQTSGAGVVLETTRIRGILRGNAAGEPQVINILADQRIQPGEHVLTAGGDQIFPRGLPVGVVEKVVRDTERGSFINVVVKPTANLQNLDEVLVITSLDPHLSPQQMADLSTSEQLKGAEVAADAERKKAAAEMAERLPGLRDASAPASQTDAMAPKDPNAAKATPGASPTAPVAVVPKPLPAKHPDRFSPGVTEGMQGGAGADAVSQSAPVVPASKQAKPIMSKPPVPKAAVKGIQPKRLPQKNSQKNPSMKKPGRTR